MTDPLVIEIAPANTWVLVAASVTYGLLYRLSNDPNQYLQTYRMAGQPAPDPMDAEGGVPMPRCAKINAFDPVDVYVMAQGKTGVLRLDQ